MFFGSLASAGENQHLQIEELARGEVVARLNDVVNHEEFSAGIHAFPAGLQYLDAFIVGPIVNDVLHDVSIGACWNGGKHIAGCESATVHHRLERAVFGSRNNVRHIEERASQLRIPLQDSGQQKSVAAGDVHDGMNAVKIVGVGDGGTATIRGPPGF